jgi:hypothetical protein
MGFAVLGGLALAGVAGCVAYLRRLERLRRQGWRR